MIPSGVSDLTLAATKPTFASAISATCESNAAVDEIIDQLIGNVNGEVDLMTVFATPHHVDSMECIRDRLHEAFSPRFLFGATAEGVIGVQQELERQVGLSVLIGHLPDSVVQPIRYDPASPDRLAYETPAAGSIVAASDPKAVILLADPFSTPVSALIPAISQAFEPAPIVGGMASGAGQPGGNRLLLGRSIHRDGAVGAVIRGNVHVQTTVSQGCRPVGRPVVITRCKRNVVLELAGQSAMRTLEQIIESLSIDDKELIQTHGLLVGRVINEYKGHFGRGDFLIRSISGVDERLGAIGIADPAVRNGQTIQFHVRDQQTAYEDFSLLLEAQKLHGPGGGALLFSCNGRGTRLFSQPNTDANLIADAMGSMPLAGFFAAGEIGPVGDENFIHGHTVCLVAFRAENEPPID